MQLLSASALMVPGGEFATTTSLNQHNPIK